ncbi:MAG: glutathione S-transferase family protein [Parvularculaceae bacterium]
MALILYDLCGADADVRFSPFCWRVKFALVHKGLDFETVPLKFTEKDNYPDPAYGRLPVLRDGDALIKDSWVILNYLEQTYPERPLAQTPAEWGAARLARAWGDHELIMSMRSLVVAHVHSAVAPEDKDYFRETREKHFGRSLESLLEDADATCELVGKKLAVLDAALEDECFIGGHEPGLSDYIIFSGFMWARSASSEDLFTAPPRVQGWIERMLAAHDGYAARAARPG